MREVIKDMFWILKAQIYNIIIWYYLLTGDTEKAREKNKEYNDKWMNEFIRTED